MMRCDEENRASEGRTVLEGRKDVSEYEAAAEKDGKETEGKERLGGFGVGGNRVFSVFDNVGNVFPQTLKSFKNIPLESFSKEYAQGAICAIGELNLCPGGYIGYADKFFPANDGVSSEGRFDDTTGPDDDQIRMFSGLQDGSDDPVLVTIVKSVEDMKGFSPSFREDLEKGQQFFDVRTGGFYPVAGSRIRGPVFPYREFSISILFTVVPANEFPDNVVKDAPQVMDGIAYYDRDSIGEGIIQDDLDKYLASFFVIVDAASVRLAQYKRFELPFKISNVMLGSFEL